MGRYVSPPWERCEESCPATSLLLDLTSMSDPSLHSPKSKAHLIKHSADILDQLDLQRRCSDVSLSLPLPVRVGARTCNQMLWLHCMLLLERSGVKWLWLSLSRKLPQFCVTQLHTCAISTVGLFQNSHSVEVLVTLRLPDQIKRVMNAEVNACVASSTTLRCLASDSRHGAALLRISRTSCCRRPYSTCPRQGCRSAGSPWTCHQSAPAQRNRGVRRVWAATGQIWATPLCCHRPPHRWC